MLVLARRQRSVECPFAYADRARQVRIISPRLVGRIDDDVAGRLAAAAFLGNDIYDRLGIGAEFGARIGDHLDLVDRVGRHRLQGRRQVGAAQRRRGLAVDQDLHRTAAHGDRSGRTDIDRGQGVEHVAQRAGLRQRYVFKIVDRAIDLVHHRRRLGRHHDGRRRRGVRLGDRWRHVLGRCRRRHKNRSPYGSANTQIHPHFRRLPRIVSRNLKLTYNVTLLRATPGRSRIQVFAERSCSMGLTTIR